MKFLYHINISNISTGMYFHTGIKKQLWMVNQVKVIDGK